MFFIQVLSCKSYKLPNDYPEDYEDRIPAYEGKNIYKDLKANVKRLQGNLSKKEMIDLYQSLEPYSKSKLNLDQGVLISFKQKGDLCYDYGYENFIAITNNIKRLSNEISERYNLRDFFVYTENAYNKSIYQSRSYYFLDTGFFKEKLFKSNTTCNAYFALKPSGEYITIYGLDAMSYLKDFME
ncbi:hypothetical protein [Winogradskyella jejuensis]|uniref:Uncharacterized protein n=1 Tax=Winogradskyella jejuensis TaxID=1089305 RepID=A0A1M5LXB9_9FLAO|nr:hypothetical protein [Winogradskyella jejuensis]SHG69707.1 hypothetical protein SAMN05444148_0745 [Winogradskyella jejuensis]